MLPVHLSSPQRVKRPQPGNVRDKGTFLWFMDDDDYASPETVTDVLRAISQPDWAARVILLPMTIVSRGIVLNHVVPREDSLRFERLRRFGHEVSTSCVIFPRGVIESVDGWDERLVAGQDTDLFLRVSRHADAKCLKTHAVSIEWQTRNVLRGLSIGSSLERFSSCVGTGKISLSYCVT